MTRPLSLPARAVLGLLLLFFLVSAGCRDTAEGQKLAATGAETAETVARYYDSLAQDTVDIWEMEAFLAALRGVELDPSQQQLLHDQLEALKRRAELARGLAGVYRALEELSAYDASGEVKQAVTGLASRLADLPALPKLSAPRAGLAGSLAGELAAWKQSRDIRQGTELALGVLEQMTALFQSERQAYQSIAEERGNKVAAVADHLIRKKMVLAWPLLDAVPRSLGLSWSTEARPAGDPETIEGLVELARVRVERSSLLARAATDHTLQSLLLLRDNHRQFLTREGLSLEAVRAKLASVAGYLEQIRELRGQNH